MMIYCCDLSNSVARLQLLNQSSFLQMLGYGITPMYVSVFKNVEDLL